MKDHSFYYYDADWTYVVDGDTIDVRMDLGMNVSITERLRLKGIDTAERGSELHDEQSTFVRQWLEDASEYGHLPLVIRTFKDETGKYGRYIAKVYRKTDGHGLHEDILEEWPDAVYE